MQQATMDQLVDWTERTFAGYEWVQKDEVLAAAKDSDLPGPAKRALKELPQARWRYDEMLFLIRTISGPQQRSDMKAPPDGVPGGGHEGEPED